MSRPPRTSVGAGSLLCERLEAVAIGGTILSQLNQHNMQPAERADSSPTQPIRAESAAGISAYRN